MPIARIFVRNFLDRCKRCDIMYKICRVIVGWPTDWALYALGDLISRVYNTGYTGWLYPMYHKCMVWSTEVQDWVDPYDDRYMPWDLSLDNVYEDVDSWGT